MFRESLLESSHSGKRNRWPMAAAFAGELIVASLLVLIPLLTTAVIHVSAHETFAPLGEMHLKSNDGGHKGTSSGPTHPTLNVVTLNHKTGSVIDAKFQTGEAPTVGPDLSISGVPDGIKDALTSATASRPIPATTAKHRLISVSSEAHLITRVEPVYPHIALLLQKQGDVKLHAIIGKDGAIESLTVTAGDPLLAGAATEAVRQWRYRPYQLNGEPVEVETFITVSFKGIRN